MNGPIQSQVGTKCSICRHTVSRWVVGSWQHGREVFRLFGPEIQITEYDEVAKFCERCAPKLRSEVLQALRDTIARLRAEALTIEGVTENESGPPAGNQPGARQGRSVSGSGRH